MIKNPEFTLVENMIALQDSNFFSMLYPTELRRIALICKEVILKPNELLIQIGDEDSNLYFVKSGSLIQENESEKSIIETGNIIKLEALFIKNHRSRYTLKAIKESTLLTFKKESLYNIILNNSNIALAMIEYLSEKLDK